jgi:hypothetical protein
MSEKASSKGFIFPKAKLIWIHIVARYPAIERISFKCDYQKERIESVQSDQLKTDSTASYACSHFLTTTLATRRVQSTRPEPPRGWLVLVARRCFSRKIQPLTSYIFSHSCYASLFGKTMSQTSWLFSFFLLKWSLTFVLIIMSALILVLQINSYQKGVLSRRRRCKHWRSLTVGDYTSSIVRWVTWTFLFI